VSAQAQITDRRFQRYAGPRHGVLYSFWSLVRYSLAWVIGFKRSTRYKLIPIIVVAIAYLPSLVLIVVATVAPPGTKLAGYAAYYQFVMTAIYIFIALTAPELICPDRRHGTLRMYMTSNLGPATYVAAKLVAVWATLAIVTVGPVLVEFLGLSLVGRGPDGLTRSLMTLGQVIGGGLLLAVFFGSVALAISSLTDRNAFASAGIILGFVLSAAALGILQGPLNGPAWIALVNVNQVPLELVSRIYQLPGTTTVPTWQLAAAGGTWVLVSIGVLVLRYRSEGSD
jgi:ABC-2 type transport system permease protein